METITESIAAVPATRQQEIIAYSTAMAMANTLSTDGLITAKELKEFKAHVSQKYKVSPTSILA